MHLTLKCYLKHKYLCTYTRFNPHYSAAYRTLRNQRFCFNQLERISGLVDLFFCSPCSTIDQMQQERLRMNPGTRSQNTNPLNTMLFSAQLGFLLPRTLTSLAQSFCFLVAWAQPPLSSLPGLAALHLILQPNSIPDISSTHAPEEEAVQSSPLRPHAGKTLYTVI